MAPVADDDLGVEEDEPGAGVSGFNSVGNYRNQFLEVRINGGLPRVFLFLVICGLAAAEALGNCTVTLGELLCTGNFFH